MVKESNSRESSVKKRRKNVSTDETGEQDVDVYKKSVQFEEKEALSRAPEADAKIYFDTCKSIRQLLFDIYDLKSQKTPEAQAKIQEKCTEACLLITVLKKLNRYDKFRSLVSREMLAQEKQKSDSINLQCQNLLYEYEYLQSECNKCRQFKSKDENIDLVPIEEFFKEAPETITSKFKNVGDESESLKHELHLARLEWELMQRKKLAELCDTFEDEKKQLATEIVELKDRLEGLGPRLAAVLEATKPLQEHLGLPVDKIRAEHKLARLLPDPLYLLYANVDAYKNVYPNLGLSVEILGDQDEAIVWKEKRESVAFSDHESDQENETEAQEETADVSKKRRHRKSTHQDRREERKTKLLAVHPLSVEICLPVTDGPRLKLKFSYYSFLKIVTVVPNVSVPSSITGSTAREVLHGESVVGGLIDDDFGLESPNPTNNYLLQKRGLGQFRDLVPDIGFAYVWAQKACGLNFLEQTNAKPNKLSQASVEAVVKALHHRFKSRAALAAQLQQLDQNLIPIIPDSVEYPRNAISTLTSWASSNWSKVTQWPSAQSLVESDIINPLDLFYSVSVTRPPAVLQALVMIKNAYPLQAPVFSLALNYNGAHHSGNSDEIRDMERAVNVGWKCTQASAEWLLSVQLRHLCAYLDVYLETIAPGTFPQSTVFFKNTCGRNHRRPFKFRKIGAGVFTQQ